MEKSDNNFLPSSLVFPHYLIYPNTVPECSNEYKDYTNKSKHTLSYPDTFLAIDLFFLWDFKDPSVNKGFF